MKWRILRYKKLPYDLKMDRDRKRGLYIVMQWNPYSRSVCPFNISNFVHVVIKKDVDW